MDIALVWKEGPYLRCTLRVVEDLLQGKGLVLWTVDVLHVLAGEVFLLARDKVFEEVNWTPEITEKVVLTCDVLVRRQVRPDVHSEEAEDLFLAIELGTKLASGDILLRFR